MMNNDCYKNEYIPKDHDEYNRYFTIARNLQTPKKILRTEGKL
jgi:hypothetical protein